TYRKKQSIPLARLLEQMLFRLPLLGPLLHKASIAQFCRTFSMTYSAGLPLIKALGLIANSMPYWIYFDACEQITNHVSAGESLQRAIQRTGLFPNRVTQMIKIGEEAGTLDQILQHLAHLYEGEVAETVDVICRLLEPIIMVILGLFIGGVVIGMYLPLFKLGALI
ncbi:MAG: type II secretion system F family protein, partial [Enhydrobacter sp.]